MEYRAFSRISARIFSRLRVPRISPRARTLRIPQVSATDRLFPVVPVRSSPLFGVRAMCTGIIGMGIALYLFETRRMPVNDCFVYAHLANCQPYVGPGRQAGRELT